MQCTQLWTFISLKAILSYNKQLKSYLLVYFLVFTERAGPHILCVQCRVS